jgi:hypothetical protein
MSKTADISEPASELEHLMADLPGLGQLVFVFGDDFGAMLETCGSAGKGCTFPVTK